MSKAMVLFSGGVDSTTCLGLAIEKYGKENVIALSISYGQKHKKEESSDTGGSNVGCGSVLLCFLFLFFAIWFTMMVDSLLK